MLSILAEVSSGAGVTTVGGMVAAAMAVVGVKGWDFAAAKVRARNGNGNEFSDRMVRVETRVDGIDERVKRIDLNLDKVLEKL